ncbi:DNA-directed RNA polymerase subunit A' [Methanothermobacter defluvii]|uniref:DNA-directed RNA polymerase subunit Rpo1N n=1 Tax=Methanothermobacter defluvii TaxID=49339 RepID=A0A371NEU0_9EURY|nr:DNA-directed RNA polymerase subunit A' [Methanothermobacter defluvii]REE29017.1 DNA-directed RNA polymerase subunit A' [Methanothermobacter defluvii]
MRGTLKKIGGIEFGLMSPKDIRKMSVAQIVTPDTYNEDGYPIENGLMDPRLGVTDPSLRCWTCGARGWECPGHFGSINLARPVIHVGFADTIHKILRSTCRKCGRVLLTGTEIEEYYQRILEAMETEENFTPLVNRVYSLARRDRCPHCEEEQEEIKLDKPVSIFEGDYKLTPSEVRERLERISDDDALILGVNPEVARPEWMVLTVLPVPPVTMRPSITLKNGERSEDDLTHKLVDILRINQRLKENMEAWAPQLIVKDLWELLQYHVTTYFDNEASGVTPARQRSGRQLLTLMQRLKSKKGMFSSELSKGRFRGNLSGKRVNFSARTVISPDPNISINEVGVPEIIAREVTVPVYVTEWNIDRMREYIENGPDVHPGANYVIRPDGRRIRISSKNTETVIENLKPGYVVERHLKDGDIVLFNRQPSLHRMSLMAHRARVLPYKTFRLNLCVCPPYNADFDGDEMNIHVLQTEESRAEAKTLMLVQEHMISPRFGGPIIGSINDQISGLYLLTRKFAEFEEEEVFQLLRSAGISLPSRRGTKWSGKEIFSLILPDDLSMTYRADVCRRCQECIEDGCEYDAYVVIENGRLESGVIDKKTCGAFSGRLLGHIIREYGTDEAREFLESASRLAIAVLMRTGFTTSIMDFDVPEEARQMIDSVLGMVMDRVEGLTEDKEDGRVEPVQVMSSEKNFEITIMKVLAGARERGGEIARKYLGVDGNQGYMITRTGLKCSLLNFTQITACLGQQSVRGERISRGYDNRTLPHFRKGELGAKSRGFVQSSYREGLDPIEFFFHAMGGRDALVDTAVRTAQSGYMQRRLINALQDLTVDEDGRVRDSCGNVIQILYGEDGVSPWRGKNGEIVDLEQLVYEIRRKSP